jgi:hypothetical protein
LNYELLCVGLKPLDTFQYNIKAIYNMFRCINSRAVLGKEVLAIKLQEGEEKWNRESVREKKWHSKRNFSISY